MNDKAEFRLKVMLVTYPFFWFLGGVPLWGLAVFLLLIGQNINRPGKVFIFFGLVQVLSTVIAIPGFWLQWDRVVPMLHNILVYLIFVFAFITASRFRLDHWGGLFKKAVFLNIICYVAIYVYSGSTKELSYSGLLHDVSFSRAGFVFSGSSVRVSFMGFYVNTAAIISCLIYFLYFSISFSVKKEKVGLFLAYICTLVAVLLSGSRIVIFVMMVFPFLVVFRAVLFRYLGLIIAPCLVFLFFYLGYFELINSFREGSSNTRGVIYATSISMMQDNNIVTGLGIKPYANIVDFPLGSHSSYIGYVVKNGFVGLAFVLLYLFFIVKGLFNSIGFLSHDLPYIRWVQVWLVSIIFIFEDLDAFELNAVLFGLLLGLAYAVPKTSRSVLKVSGEHVK